MRVVIDRVGHEFAGASIFSQVTASIDGPTSAAVMGPSGVGKSTLLAIIGGLIDPAEGRVSFESGDREIDRAGISISWVLQTTNAFANKSVVANVAAPLTLANLDPREADDRSRRLVDRLGLGDRSEAKARRLSGGELQRLGIARALASRADLILADEPTGQLDEALSEEVAGLMLAELPEESTLIVVTHDPVVAGLCATVLELTATGMVQRT